MLAISLDNTVISVQISDIVGDYNNLQYNTLSTEKRSLEKSVEIALVLQTGKFHSFFLEPFHISMPFPRDNIK